MGCGGPGGKMSFAVPFLYCVALRGAKRTDDFKCTREARSVDRAVMLRYEYQTPLPVFQVERMPAVAAISRRARVCRDAAVYVICRHEAACARP